MIAIFTLILAANEAREVAISGEYFELRNALFPVTLIELLDRSGGVISRMDNPEQSDFVRPGHYETVRITNGATAQTIKHFYGSGDAGSRRTSGLVRIDGASDVSVIDGAKNTTLANKAFLTRGGLIGAAGLNSFVQLKNPAGSGVNIFLKGIFCSVLTASGVSLSRYDTDLTFSSFCISKDLSGLAGLGKIQIATSATLAGGGSLFFLDLAAGIPSIFKMDVPILLRPGVGVTLGTTINNTSLNASFETTEELI